MKRGSQRMHHIFYEAQRFVVFFVLVAFVVTCCTMLFVSNMQSAMHLTFTADDIQTAARLTFWNIFLITLLLVALDRLQRMWLVERPIRQISAALEKMMQGDLKARVPAMPSLSYFGGIARDINRMADELGSTETLRTDFIANVSHELKTPLAVMQNYATLLAEPGLSEDRRAEYARAISDTSRRLASLITNILRLNKLENQQIFPQNDVYDLGEQLCECLLQFEDAWEGKDIQIETDLAEDVRVRCDAELMTLVWNNLFSNAVKFTAPGGTIRLSLHTEGSSAVVSVADTGCGFGAEVGRHIFEKFYQGDKSHATQGNGLGLALVKRVVDIVGGDISVESEVGRGTAFTVRIRRMSDGAA